MLDRILPFVGKNHIFNTNIQSKTNTDFEIGIHCMKILITTTNK